MNRSALAYAAIMLSLNTFANRAGFAIAGDLPVVRLEAPTPVPPWTGFYAGINTGYAWGGSSSASTVSAPLNDSYASILAQIATANSYQFQGFLPGSTSLANAGTASLNANGFIGGGQIGYNLRIGTKFMVGMESDIQATTISSGGSYVGGAVNNASFTTPGAYQGNETRSTLGAGSITAGVDWMGTVRGRVGYLITPELLVYGTGGLAYGGVKASARHTMLLSTSYTEDFANVCIATAVGPGPYSCGPGAFPTTAGFGNYSGTQVGWAAGGGFEWMFRENWSLKAEAIFYDLANITLNASPVAAYDFGDSPWLGLSNARLVANVPSTRVKFDGVIARAGLNYHFNWDSPAAVLVRP